MFLFSAFKVFIYLFLQSLTSGKVPISLLQLYYSTHGLSRLTKITSFLTNIFAVFQTFLFVLCNFFIFYFFHFSKIFIFSSLVFFLRYVKFHTKKEPAATIAYSPAKCYTRIRNVNEKRFYYESI